jgi:hypothetical protein
LVSGACTTLIAIVAVELYPLGFSWVSHPIDIAGTFIIILGVYLLISMVPQALGAWYQQSRQRSGLDPGDPVHQAITGRRYRYGYFFVALLVFLLILPLGLLALPVDTTDYFTCPGGTTCQPGDQCGAGKPPDNVTVSRTSPDSVRVSLKTASMKCGSQNTFKILLNGNDVSNQELVKKSGLDVTITPREGMGQTDGAFVILQGKDLASSETTPPHIQVMITDRSTTWIHRDLYL